MTLYFSMAKKKDVVLLLNQNHYIGSQCADPTYVFAWRREGGLFGDAGEPAAAALFAPSAARAWGARTIELTRLVRDSDVTEPLTSFLSACVKFISSRQRFDLIVSYADPSAGHHGGIYQAASWIYVGMSKGKMQWINKNNGKRSSQRSFDQSSYCETEGWERIKTCGKHIYVCPLTKAQRKAWAPKSLAYPKPFAHCAAS
jgi:hypothetical protein